MFVFHLAETAHVHFYEYYLLKYGVTSVHLLTSKLDLIVRQTITDQRIFAWGCKNQLLHQGLKIWNFFSCELIINCDTLFPKMLIMF